MGLASAGTKGTVWIIIQPQEGDLGAPDSGRELVTEGASWYEVLQHSGELAMGSLG